MKPPSSRQRGAPRRASSPRSARRMKWRRLSPYMAAGVFVLAMMVGYVTGRFDRVDDRIASVFFRETADAGLQVADVSLEGRQFTPSEDVMAALKVHAGDPIFAFDPDQARASLEALPRIASADVQRHLPSTIIVKLTERAPMAIWQHNGHLAVIDRDGVVLDDREIGSYASLPMVVGDTAAETAYAVLQSVGSEPALARRVTAYIRVGARRWNLKLDNNAEIRLPETGVDAAVRRVAQAEASAGLLERDVVSIDLRLPGRMIVETGQLRDPRRKPQPQQGI